MTNPPAWWPTGRVAIVTGGTRGCGRAIALNLAISGYAVVVGYVHDRHAADAAVEAILGVGAAVAVRADVTDPLDVSRLFAETIETFGGVDVVVHTVASRPATQAAVAEVDLDDFDALVRINTRAAFIVNRAAARHVRSGGAIVNLTSSLVESPAPNHGLPAATMAAVDALTRALALELRERHITVNAVSLGVDRPSSPGRVADAVAHLLSDHDHRRTGQVLRIDDPGPGPHDATRQR